MLFELLSGKRKSEDVKVLAPPKKLLIMAGEDNAWTYVNHSARNVRPFCGDWDQRFKELEKNSVPEKEALD